MPRIRAFTLIELLVVITIIAVLIGILLPGLGGARTTARSVRCLSNMRQLSAGWAMYAHENDDISIPGQPGRFAEVERNLTFIGNGYHYRPRWFAILGSAAGFHAYGEPSPDPAFEHSYPIQHEVFLCPEASDWISTRNCGYGYNHQFLGNARWRDDAETSGSFINFPVRASSVLSSSTVLFGDSLGTAAGKPASERTPNLADGSRYPELTAMGGHGYAIDPPRLIAGADSADRRNRGFEHRSAPHERHRNRTNIAFCDGRAESTGLRELGYETGDDGRVLADGPGASNALFSGGGTDDDPPLVSP